MSAASERDLRKAQLAELARRAKKLRANGCGTPYGRPVLAIIERNIARAEERERVADRATEETKAQPGDSGPELIAACLFIVALIALAVFV